VQKAGSRCAPADRAAALGRLADALTGRKGVLADLTSAEIGSPRSWSTFGQVLTAVGVLRAYASITPDYPFESTRPSVAGGTVQVRQLPVGVVGAIIPWNTPLFIAALKLGPALAAGCTVVLKPAPDAPLSIGVLTEAIEEAGLPDGVVNIVNGGAATGQALTSHPGVDKVSFTGSTTVGAQIAASCGARIRGCSTELGGKSAAIVLPDAPVESTVAGLVAGVMGNNGQLCAALTRILLPRSRYDEFAGALVAAVADLVVGDPADRSTQIGPVINEAARDKIEGFLRRARADGATILTGGGRPDGPGWFITPAVVAATNDMEIAREEVFGPVAVVIGYDDSVGDAEAVAIANDSRYGLVGAVWSGDDDRAADVGSRLQAGSVAINSTAVLDFGSPFGGFKMSGIGREGGPEGIAGFVEYQAIVRQSRKDS
jgi:betaine-aldehyde dehydrogenase